MVRARAIRVSLAVLLLGGCVGREFADVIDPVTGCCVTRAFDTADLGGFAPCTCSCDGGACAVDQPIGPNGGVFARACSSSGAPGAATEYKLDLGCESRR